MLKVFLSHSHKDVPAVHDLHARLVAAGVKPWLDEKDLLPGQKWEEEIANSVEGSDIALVCLSHSSIRRHGFFQAEIRQILRAADKHPPDTIFLIPLKFEEIAEEKVPRPLRGLQWADYFEQNGFERLMKSLRKRAAQLRINIPAPEAVGTTVSVSTAADGGTRATAPRVAENPARGKAAESRRKAPAREAGKASKPFLDREHAAALAGALGSCLIYGGGESLLLSAGLDLKLCERRPFESHSKHAMRVVSALNSAPENTQQLKNLIGEILSGSWGGFGRKPRREALEKLRRDFRGYA